jgi:hypothetical protein
MPQTSEPDVIDPASLRASVDAVDIVFDVMTPKRRVVRYDNPTGQQDGTISTVYVWREAWLKLGKPDKVHVRIAATR